MLKWSELDTFSAAIAALLAGLTLFFTLSLFVPPLGLWVVGGFAMLAIAFILLTKVN